MNEKPYITLDFPKCRIRLLTSSLKALQFPDYVRLLVNPMQKIIALQVGDAEDNRAQRLIGRYEKSNSRVDLHSKELMEKLMLCGEWDITKPYKLEGIFHPEEGMIVYPISCLLKSGEEKVHSGFDAEAKMTNE